MELKNALALSIIQKFHFQIQLIDVKPISGFFQSLGTFYISIMPIKTLYGFSNKSNRLNCRKFIKYKISNSSKITFLFEDK